MDHKYIDELELVDRYLMGRLPVDESARFEEHFVDCSRCVDRLEATKDLIQGLRLVATHQPAEGQGYSSRGLHWYSRHVVSRKWFALAGGFLLLVSLAGMGVSNRIRLSRIEADQAKSVSAQWERRYEEERQAASLVDGKHEETEHELASQLNQLHAELENERKIAQQYEGSKQPQINLPIFGLKSARGSQSSADTINELTIPRSPASFVISLALEGDGGYKDYRVTILRDHGQLIWKGRGFKPDRYNSLSVGFNSTFFRDGNYLLTVEGVAGDGNASVVGKYSFRVLKTL
jgi:hypothetical protein